MLAEQKPRTAQLLRADGRTPVGLVCAGAGPPVLSPFEKISFEADPR
jgi:hypothetical protein